VIITSFNAWFCLLPIYYYILFIRKFVVLILHSWAQVYNATLILFLAEQESTKQESKGSLAEVVKERDQVCSLLFKTYACVLWHHVNFNLLELIWLSTSSYMHIHMSSSYRWTRAYWFRFSFFSCVLLFFLTRVSLFV